MEADGGVGGNLAVRYGRGILISKSGKAPGRRMTEEDFVYVVDFDVMKWHAYYASAREEIRPSSDTPVHWAVLVKVPLECGWKEAPAASVHGHALADGGAAVRLEIPVSPQATLFSTSADMQAVCGMLRRHPYPEHRIWIRKHHGFVAAGKSPTEALNTSLEAMHQR